MAKDTIGRGAHDGSVFRRVSLAAARDTCLSPLLLGLAAEAVALTPWLFGPGTHMDEGAILTYARLVWHGYIPMRDVRSFYGPLNSYIVGAVLQATGWSFLAERVLGLVYRLALAAALLGLVRSRGWPTLTAATALLVLLPPSYSISASAASAAGGATVIGILIARSGRPGAAGVAAGVALLMRFDWVPAVIFAALPWFLRWDGRRRIRWLIGFGALASLYLPYLGIVGQSNVRYLVRTLRAGQAARALPLPWAPEPAGIVLDLTIACLLLLLVMGLRRRQTTEGTTFLSVGLMTLASLPYALVAADRYHALEVGLPAIVLSAAGVAAVSDELSAHVRLSLRRMLGIGWVSTAALLLVLSLTVSAEAGSTLLPRRAFLVQHDGRRFLLPSATEAAQARQAVERADEIAPPNGRLYVGPGDLGGLLSDTYMYFLLPRLHPATFFIAVDPGVMNLRPHRLADEIARADVLILDRVESSVPPSSEGAAAREVIRAHDCLRGRFGRFEVLARCRVPQHRTRDQRVARSTSLVGDRVR